MKMHGLGNDFVVVDGRDSRIELTDSLISAVADRHRGVGFDQLAVILPSDVDAHLDFYNSDGSKSAACGNATRCIARFLMNETGKTTLDLKNRSRHFACYGSGRRHYGREHGTPHVRLERGSLGV